MQDVLKAVHRKLRLIQVLTGPRQVGKSTAADQIVKHLGWPAHFASADSPIPHQPEWIEAQWQLARRKCTAQKSSILVLDEIQKIPGWSEKVKHLWDYDKKEETLVQPLLLGSAALLIEEGLTESLAGRFFLHRVPHWSWVECQQAFGWKLEQWLYYGGYPGAAALIEEEQIWKSYVRDSLIETVLARDVLQKQTVHKPALLRNLFGLATTFPAQILSYNKMLGQLSDAGNTTTLAHYLRLLSTAFLVSGLELYSRGHIKKRGSSPKLVLWNNALITATSLLNFEQTLANTTWWGRIVENAVGAHLLNHLQESGWSISYWREGNQEVDYVVTHGTNTWAVEVKSGLGSKASGLGLFKKKYPNAKVFIIGEVGLSLNEFFSYPADHWFKV